MALPDNIIDAYLDDFADAFLFVQVEDGIKINTTPVQQTKMQAMVQAYNLLVRSETGVSLTNVVFPLSLVHALQVYAVMSTTQIRMMQKQQIRRRVRSVVQ